MEPDLGLRTLDQEQDALNFNRLMEGDTDMFWVHDLERPLTRINPLTRSSCDFPSTVIRPTARLSSILIRRSCTSFAIARISRSYWTTMATSSESRA